MSYDSCWLYTTSWSSRFKSPFFDCNSHFSHFRSAFFLSSHHTVLTVIKCKLLLFWKNLVAHYLIKLYSLLSRSLQSAIIPQNGILSKSKWSSFAVHHDGLQEHGRHKHYAMIFIYIWSVYGIYTGVNAWFNILKLISQMLGEIIPSHFCEGVIPPQWHPFHKVLDYNLGRVHLLLTNSKIWKYLIMD